MVTGSRSAICAVLLGTLLLATRALADLQLVIDGGSGRRGETVAVAIRLANDPDGSAVTADIDLDFPTDLVEVVPPVSSACTIAPRLAETHRVGGKVSTAGRLSLAVLPRRLEHQPLGDGDLASCAFNILADAGSSPAVLEVAFTSLDDDTGEGVPLETADGAIVITDAPGQPTPTPVQTPTPVPNCVADCDGDGMVTVSEVIRGVNIALGNQPVSECPDADADSNGGVAISELITAIIDVLGGC